MNIRSKDWDGRISRENKEWANEFLANFAPEIRERPDGCFLTTHPGIINLFANTVRSHLEKEKELAAQEKDEIYDTLELKNNSITFSVVTIEGEDSFVVPEYVDNYNIRKSYCILEIFLLTQYEISVILTQRMVFEQYIQNKIAFNLIQRDQ